MRARHKLIFSGINRISVLALIGSAASHSFGDVIGDMGANGVNVRERVCFKNTTGIRANDFHVEFHPKEDGLHIRGATITSPTFPNVSSNFARGDGQHPQHEVHSDMDGADVAAGASMYMDINMIVSGRNSTKFRWHWTKDDNPISDEERGGWDLGGDPTAGGDGGDAGDANGAGGNGGQEDNEDSDGVFHYHPLSIINDKDEDIIVDNIRMLASMTRYIDLDAIETRLDLVTPISLGPILIPANSEWTYNFDTTGSYLGGHVYFAYETFDPILRGSGPNVKVIGDHPTTPAPGTLALLGLGSLCGARRRR